MLFCGAAACQDAFLLLGMAWLCTAHALANTALKKGALIMATRRSSGQHFKKQFSFRKWYTWREKQEHQMDFFSGDCKAP